MLPRFDRPWEVIENPVDTTPGRWGDSGREGEQ